MIHALNTGTPRHADGPSSRAAQAKTEIFTLKSPQFVMSGFKTIFPKVGVKTPQQSGYITRMDAYLIDDTGHLVLMLEFGDYAASLAAPDAGGQPECAAQLAALLDRAPQFRTASDC